MATLTCDPSLLSDAECLTCLTESQLLAIIACQLAAANGMSCDPNILLADARCLTCLTPFQLLAIIACQLASSSGGGFPLLTGIGSPQGVVTPAGAGQRYWDTEGGVFYTNVDGTVNGWNVG